MTRIFVRIFITLILPTAVFAGFDTGRYIPLEEIQPGMQGYALSVYSGTKIEKFSVEVISVVKDYRPGKDAIFVMGTDERFKHTGPVQGCSGSPVVLDGRIAGALAFGWSFVKDPLYGVTPIGEMLEIGTREEKLASPAVKLNIDYSNLDFSNICNQLASMIKKNDSPAPMGLKQLEVPIVSSLGSDVCSRLETLFGIRMLAGTSSGEVSNPVAGSCIPNFEAGSVISIPMVDGDMKMAAIGTVTDVVGDKMYAFGHAFEAAGEANLPMATGLIHMVVANQISSFKFGQSGQIIGAITNDSATGIYGKIGEKAPMIPLKITVNRSDNYIEDVYNCQVAVHDFYTPYLVQAAIAGAALAQGDVPQEHTVDYKCRLGIEGFDDIYFQRTSSAQSIAPAINDAAGPIALLMNNRFHKAKITNIDFSIDIQQGENVADITYVETDKVIAEPGDNIQIKILTEKLHSQKKSYNATIKLPDDITPGQYQLMVGGSDFYAKFLNTVKPYERVIDDFATLLEAINKQLTLDAKGLYIVMQTGDNGISIGKAPLVGLPASRAHTLASPTRNYLVAPIFDWVEQRVATEDIIQSQQQQINIIVQEKN